MKRYDPKTIEPKWQKIWEETGTYTADLDSDRPKYIAMSMFNYPSGAGIHIGHAMNYTISDVKARFKRQSGYESYHPVGWDSFGLPAENYAITAGVSPQESMATIIPSYHKQYKAMGWSNDWEKEIAVHLPEYYKWSQWIFSEMYRNDLAYQDSRMQWWCTKCQTVLANEQVIDGKCWRHDSADDPFVEKREVKQWFFKITDYADELLEAIESLDWSESVKLAQKNWIGRSVGAEIDFAVDGTKKKITVFTTRPDTLYGATFMVLAPEHELVQEIVTKEQKSKVNSYIQAAQKKTDVERQAAKQKTGVFTGAYAINPLSGEKTPIWVADYVLMGYGTGAIMGVPAHDERDHEFAQKYKLPIREVLEPFYTQTTEPGKLREGMPYDHRDAIIAVVKHWSEDKYLALKWKQVAWGTFITGGIEEGQTAEQAAAMEIREETGYLNPKLVTDYGMVHGLFYHVPKKVNRFAHARAMLFQLSDDKRQKIEAEEKAIHEILWLSAEELEKFLTPDTHKHVLRYLMGTQGVHEGEGIMVNSGLYDGLPSSEAREKIVVDLAKAGAGREQVNYRMQDWSVSRQRYWGAPIPIIHCKKCGPVLVPDKELPVVLPVLDDFQPSGDGRSALARAKDWLSVECPKCGGQAERETDTLDTYIDSSWYMYRYFDPHNMEKIFDERIVKKWEPIDFYNGADHATAHLLYARFIARFFTKLGLINEPEPFKQFLFNGKVTAHDGQMFSKSKGNGVDPLEIIDSGYGADALRLYLMFAAPLEMWARWDPQGVPGTFRFLTRLWNLVHEYLQQGEAEMSGEQKKQMQRATHQMIKKVTEDIEQNRYNTAIAATMSLLNELYKQKAKAFAKNTTWQQALESLVASVAPFAPHAAEDLWHQLGHSTSVHIDTWPKWDETLAADELVTIVVQVNGKVRDQLVLAPGADEATVTAEAKSRDKVKAYLKDGKPKRTIYVPDKLINFVIS